MKLRNSTMASLLATVCVVFSSCGVMAFALSEDIQVNEPDPNSEGMATFQVETSIRINPDTGMADHRHVEVAKIT